MLDFVEVEYAKHNETTSLSVGCEQSVGREGSIPSSTDGHSLDIFNIGPDLNIVQVR